jgi:flagellar hook-associated protein 3 FlgL
MRVSNDTLRMAFLNALETAQRRILDTQTQVSTGRRINKPSDDPVASARIADLDASLARLDQYQANGIIARNQLGLEEETLARVVDELQTIHELALQGNNATLSADDRTIVAGELRERFDALVALANRTDGSGRFLFAGFSETTQAFTVGTGNAVTYNGDQGQRMLQINDERFVATNDPGSEVFQRIPTGNGVFVLSAAAGNTGSGVLGAGTVVNPAAFAVDTYTISFLSPTTYEVRNSGGTLIASGAHTPGQSIAFLGIDVPIDGQPAAGDSFTVAPSTHRDVFATVNALIIALEAPVSGTASRAQLGNRVGQLLADIDQATEHVIGARSEIGARLRALDQEESLTEDFSVQLTETLSDIRDLDYAEALSRLSQQLFGLEAAQQAYARTQGLSLFNYL